jgi:tetratricopeptide (TPR) repeat protein
LIHIPLAAIILFRQALQHINQGNHELALKYLGNAVVIAPLFTKALCEMGYCYEKLGRYPEAISKYNKVLEINPSNAEAEMSRKKILDEMDVTK